MAKKPTFKRPRNLDLLDALDQIGGEGAITTEERFRRLRAILAGTPGVTTNIAVGNKPEDKSALSGHVPDHMLNRGVPAPEPNPCDPLVEKFRKDAKTRGRIKKIAEATGINIKTLRNLRYGRTTAMHWGQMMRLRAYYDGKMD